MKNVYVNIRMSQELKEQLTEMAKKDSRSLSNFICLTLEEKANHREKRTQIKHERTQIGNTLEIPDGVSEQTWADFKKLRAAKKAPVTDRALDGIYKEAMKADITLEAALQEMCARGWTGFKAEWVQNKHDEVSALLKLSVPYLEM